MSSEVPEGWDATDIASLFAVSTSGHWGEDGEVDGNILVLRSANFLKSGGLNYGTAARRKFDEKKLAQKRLERGDLLLERSGGSPAQPVGRVNRFDTDGDYSASNFLQILRTRETVDNSFAYYLLDSFYASGGTEHLQKATTGIRNLDFASYLASPIQLPPLDEQRRIVEVLRSIDGAISAARTLREQSLYVKQLLIDDLCHGAGEDRSLNEEDLPSGWRLVSLGDVLESVRYGTSAKCDATAQEGLPVLRIPNVVGGRVDLDDLKFANVAEADEHRFRLRNGDILLVRTNGNPAYVGRNALVTNVSSSLLFASYLIRLRCDPKSVSAAYVHAAFNSTRIRAGLLRSATTSAGNYNINAESLRALTIPLPSLPEQRRIADEIASASVTFDCYDHDLRAKKTLREHLAPELLSGRVRVPA